MGMIKKNYLSSCLNSWPNNPSCFRTCFHDIIETWPCHTIASCYFSSLSGSDLKTSVFEAKSTQQYSNHFLHPRTSILFRTLFIPKRIVVLVENEDKLNLVPWIRCLLVYLVLIYCWFPFCLISAQGIYLIKAYGF